MTRPYCRRFRPSPGPALQRGAVLVVGLVVLLILTLIGVVGMRTAMLEERMAGNLADAHVAFQAAEAALRDGEVLLQQPALPNFDGANGLHPAADADERPLWQTIDWDSADVRTYAGMVGAPYPLNKASARYFIEELSFTTGPGESLSTDTPVDELGFYRITARGVGISGNATVTLQSTFKR